MLILSCDLESYASFLFRSVEEDEKWKNLFHGHPRLGEYPVPLGIRNSVGSEKRSNVLPDFTNMGLTPVPTFSERAVHALKDILEECGELAPIEMDEAMRYWGFNPTKMVEGLLDMNKSDIKYFPGGRVMRVAHYELNPITKPLPWIFKIPETRRNTTYVNQDFVNKVKEHKLTGFKFLDLP